MRLHSYLNTDDERLSRHVCVCGSVTLPGGGGQWGSKGHVLEEEPLEAIHRRQRNNNNNNARLFTGASLTGPWNRPAIKPLIG